MAIAGVPWVASSLPSQSREVTATQAEFFESKIRPLLVQKCMPCHGESVQMAGLRADSIEALLKGGASGAALVVGDPEESLLIAAIRQTGRLKMPQGGKLSPGEIAELEAWVKMGAPWPTSVARPASNDLWSLKPVKKPTTPRVKNPARVSNAIDAFVLSNLEAKGEQFAPEADRATLIRRITYDLIGLPPTAAEVDAFLGDRSPNAYEKVVDRLLASPHYGERWARLWLDVARYADTKGYVFEEERNYFNAYTYRDWVIQAFNADLPYDRFILQQLAADRLPEVQNGDDKRPLAALGFLTVGRRFLNNQPDIVDDRIDVTMRGFEGLTVGCARCHDHKFDPIPTQDYYSLYGVFASSQEMEAPISEKSIREPWQAYSKRVAEGGQRIQEIVKPQVKRLRDLAKGPNELTTEVRQTLQALREEQVPQGEVLDKLLPAFEPAERERLNTARKDFAALLKSAPPRPEIAMAMADGPNPSDGVVFKRGNPGNPGGPAPRRFLAALSKTPVTREHWTLGSGRLELAKAIASKENPLTARVFVNRLWQHHFGSGLVRTPSDFGHQGEKPTHPGLLDFLAGSFMESGWSVKKLQKTIVMSSTYRQTSMVPATAFQRDPENRLLNRMNRRRLDLEQMRDSILMASRKLDLSKIGGKSADIWSQPFSNRRSLYAYVERQNLPFVFKAFDFASPDSSSGRRFSTTVPQQALFFLNSPFVIEQARAVAEGLEMRDAKDDAQRVRRIYQALLARLPDADEMAAGIAYLKPGAALALEPPEAVWTYCFGRIDPFTQRVSLFERLNHFEEAGYRVGKAFPDRSLGYLVLNSTGGHPGHDLDHAAIRRWRAPADLTIQIKGKLSHGQDNGDGVHARIVSSRVGELGEWKTFKGATQTEVASHAVQKGEIIDFVVDPIGNDAFDAFGWTIKILSSEKEWDSEKDFGPPPPPPLTRLALYAQALMMSNAFLFVD